MDFEELDADIQKVVAGELKFDHAVYELANANEKHLHENSKQYIYENKPYLIRYRNEVYRQYSLLCIELKFLYVAITRPKKRLIIYDYDANAIKPILRYWESMGIVDVLNKAMLETPEKLSPHIKELFQQGALSAEHNTEEEWRIQGIKFFKKKYYDGAIKCFAQSMDEDLVKRCRAY